MTSFTSRVGLCLLHSSFGVIFDQKLALSVRTLRAHIFLWRTGLLPKRHPFVEQVWKFHLSEAGQSFPSFGTISNKCCRSGSPTSPASNGRYHLDPTATQYEQCNIIRITGTSTSARHPTPTHHQQRNIICATRTLPYPPQPTPPQPTTSSETRPHKTNATIPIPPRPSSVTSPRKHGRYHPRQ